MGPDWEKVKYPPVLEEEKQAKDKEKEALLGGAFSMLNRANAALARFLSS